MEAERKKYNLEDLQESYPDAPVELLQDHFKKGSSWEEVKEDLHRCRDACKDAWGKYYQGLPKVDDDFLTERYRSICDDLKYSRSKPDTLSRTEPGRHKTQRELEAEGLALPGSFGQNLDPERYAHRVRRELLVEEFKKESPRVPKDDLRAEIDAIDFWLEGKLEHPTVWNIAVMDEFPSGWLKLRKKNLTPNSPQSPPADSGPRNFGIEQPTIDTWPNIEAELGHSRHSIEGIYGYAALCKVAIRKNLKGQVSITQEDKEKITRRFPPKPKRKPRKPRKP